MVLEKSKDVVISSFRSRYRIVLTFAGFAALLGQVACTDNPSIVRYEAEKAPVVEQAAVATGAQEASSRLVWTAPESWMPGKASSMRLASFLIPIEGGDGGDVSLVKLAGSAGGELANVNRWAGQLGMPPYTAETVQGVLMDRTTTAGLAYKLVTLVNEESDRAILVGYYMIGGDAVFAKIAVSHSALETVVSEFLKFCDSVGMDSE